MAVNAAVVVKLLFAKCIRDHVLLVACLHHFGKSGDLNMIPPLVELLSAL